MSSNKVEFDFNEIDRRLSELVCYGYTAKQLYRQAVEDNEPSKEWWKMLFPFLDALSGRLQDISQEFICAFRHIEHNGKWSNDAEDLPPFVKIERGERELKVVE